MTIQMLINQLSSKERALLFDAFNNSYTCVVQGKEYWIAVNSDRQATMIEGVWSAGRLE